MFFLNHYLLELKDCRKRLEEERTISNKLRKNIDYWKQACHELSMDAAELKEKLMDYNLVTKVLGADKLNEIINQGRIIEENERQQRELERKLRRTRSRGMSL